VSDGILSAQLSEAELRGLLDDSYAQLGHDEDCVWLRTTAAISPDLNGGPLLNAKGEVIGVCAGSRVDGQTLNFAIDVRHVEAIATRSDDRLRPLADLPKPRLTRPEAIRAPAAAPLPNRPAVADDPDPLLGKRVFVKPTATAKARHAKVNKPGTRDIPVETIPFPAFVEEVQGKWLWLGVAWVRKSDVLDEQQALELFSALISLEVSERRWWHNRAAVWSAKGLFDNAIRDLTEAIRLDPDSRAYNNRGTAWFAKGDNEAAIADFTEAIRFDRRNAFAYRNRADAWNRKGDFDASIADSSAAIRLLPENASAYRVRAMARRGKGDHDAAIKDFTEAIRLDPKFVFAYVDRGTDLANRGDYDEAIDDFNEAIRLDPKYALAYNNLAWLHATCADAKIRDGKKAVELATKACELSNWKDGSCVDTLAAAYAESGDWSNAVKRQEEAIEMATDATARQEGIRRLESYTQRKPHRDQPRSAK
jgi:tetratricopeptide (TPR) repeat protein